MADNILANRAALGAEWLAHRFDETTGTIRFVDYDRQMRGAVPFLTDDHLPPRAFRSMTREAARVIGQVAPVHFIFHSGFCCSTLLTACLDRPGLASGLSEPMILNDVVGWRMRGASPDSVMSLLTDALRLLARPFPGDPAVVIKPSNVVNGLAAAMLAAQPQARAITMHAPLDDFLVSIAKKGIDGRRWVRELFVKLRAEGRVQSLGFTDLDFLGQTDLQIAAMAWLAQQSLFQSLISGAPDRVRSLDSTTFLAQPDTILTQAAAHFGLPLDSDQLAQILAGPLQRNSKDGRRFTAADRAADYDGSRTAHADEIGKVVLWTHEVARSVGLPATLGAPLTPHEA
ncbi:MAG: hypothetical protein JHD35_11100 [Sphingopyxis sp.]|nr:hypothetical protein [Sphingopyxis sp.]